MYWYLKNKEYFEGFKSIIDKHYPTLIVLILDNLVHLKGTIKIKDRSNVVLDNFKVNIKIPNNFPMEIPEVWEIGNRIPWDPDRHIEKDGKACLCFRDEVFLYWDSNSDIIYFMDKFVEPFFLWQIEYEVTGGKNKEKAYLHGERGAIQFYKRISETENLNSVRVFVEYLTKKKIKGHWNCYCGSGRKIRDCHFDLINKYKQKIRSKDAKRTLEDFNRAKI